MKIAFDQQVFLLQEYGGISRYICNLAKHLSQMPDTETRVVAPLHFNRNLNDLGGVPGKGLMLPKLHPKLSRIAMEISKYSARMLISHFAPDMLHETYFSFDDFQPRGAKRVLTVYDLIHERYPDEFGSSYVMTTGPKKTAALRADHVICISERTRRDLIEFCGISEEKTSVVYLGVDQKFIIAGQTSRTIDSLQRPYLLYVGSRNGYKNFDRFVKAFSRSVTLKNEFDIVCFGGGPLRAHELESAAVLGLREDQIIHRAGDDTVLAALYRGAEALVYPSLYEGFGLPPLEAMAANCPVILSNTSSLPEVAGGAGEYFNPNCEQSMTAAMELVLRSASRRAGLIEKGQQQYRKFSWEKCARETMEIYRSLM